MIDDEETVRRIADTNIRMVKTEEGIVRVVWDGDVQAAFVVACCAAVSAGTEMGKDRATVLDEITAIWDMQMDRLDRLMKTADDKGKT